MLGCEVVGNRSTCSTAKPGYRFSCAKMEAAIEFYLKIWVKCLGVHKFKAAIDLELQNCLL